MSHSAIRYGPLTIWAAYVFFGVTWILLSGRVVLAMAGTDTTVLAALETGKGWAYVFGSGAVLWALVRRRDRALSVQSQLLGSILDNMGDCVIMVDVSGRVREMNPAAVALFGPVRALSELRGWFGRDGATPLPTEDQPLVRGLRGEATDQTLLFVRNRHVPAGRCYSVTGRNVRGHGGDTLGAVVVLHDVTATHRAEARLRASEALFHTVARLAPVVIFRCDATGGCVYLNERWAETSGLSVAESLGDGWARCLHPDDRERVRAEWAECVRLRRPFSTEYRLQAADGRTRWFLARTAEEVDAHDQLVGFVGTLTDITDRRSADEATRRHAGELERRVGEREAQAEASSRELDTFSYSVSHDLRAPLRTIAGFSQMVLEESGEALPPVARGHLTRVVAASRRMGEIIDGLLNLARVTRVPLNGEWVDMSAMGEAVFEELRGEDPARVVETRVAPGMRLWGDPTLLRIALENLSRNAWKFTRHTDGARIEVAPLVDGQSGVVVRDNGAGFDMAWADKLFRAFERLHPTHVFPGSGIGLATVHRIVARHGGRVWADGAVGAGASFAFTVAPGPLPEV